jgi:excinuclease UvrABC ATPase subunit
MKNICLNKTCSECEGTKLKKFVLSIKFGGKNINELTNLTITDLNEFFKKEFLKLKGSTIRDSSTTFKRNSKQANIPRKCWFNLFNTIS